MPFVTKILGAQARVERVDLNDADEISAVCCRGRERQTIPILDLAQLEAHRSGQVGLVRPENGAVSRVTIPTMGRVP